jgi:hypothetical protein
VSPDKFLKNLQTPVSHRSQAVEFFRVLASPSSARLETVAMNQAKALARVDSSPLTARF